MKHPKETKTRLHLEDVVTEVERGTWLPLSCILKEFIEVVPVALREGG